MRRKYASIASTHALSIFTFSSVGRLSAAGRVYGRRGSVFASREDRIKRNHQPAAAAHVLFKALHFHIGKPQLARLNTEHKKRRIAATLHSQQRPEIAFNREQSIKALVERLGAQGISSKGRVGRINVAGLKAQTEKPIEAIAKSNQDQ